jgi:hypothetical protein
MNRGIAQKAFWFGNLRRPASERVLGSLAKGAKQP